MHASSLYGLGCFHVIWLESLYVKQDARRTGAASLLFRAAEDVARSYGQDTLYNYVHPNNDGMIAFLRKHGYSTLNLIEIRKQHDCEVLGEEIRIRNNVFWVLTIKRL